MFVQDAVAVRGEICNVAKVGKTDVVEARFAAQRPLALINFDSPAAILDDELRQVVEANQTGLNTASTFVGSSRSAV